MTRLVATLRSGNWKTLLACFVYFDTGFTVWVMLGPLAPFIARQLSLSPTQASLLVAVPLLAASVARVMLGNAFQCVDGRRLALLGVALSAIPALVWLLPVTPTYTLLLLLGVFLGVGGASFAIALPMAGSSYPPRVQGLVLGLAAAGNVGAVVDGFVFPQLAQRHGWQAAAGAVLPLLALAALTLIVWAEDRSAKSAGSTRALVSFAVCLAGLGALVLLVGLLGRGNTGPLLLPLLGLLLAFALLPRKYLAVLAERDTWVIMLIYAITFGGFVGMSAYVSLLLTAQYHMPKVEAGDCMAALSVAGALLRPLGGLIADRLSGVKVLLVLLAAISLCNFAFAALMPPLVGGIILLSMLYGCFGLGNGATFQLVPQRWKGRTGLMTGVIGAAGGIGGFYLPVVMGIAKQGTGSYQIGFVAFGVLAAAALLVVGALHRQWQTWALPDQAGSSPSESAGPILDAPCPINRCAS